MPRILTTTDIKGLEWKIRILPEDLFKKLHEDSSETTLAITITNISEIHFRYSHCELGTIIHELTHAYFHSCLIGTTSEITPSDMEEIFCEINCHHLIEILNKSKIILNALKKENIKWKRRQKRK